MFDIRITKPMGKLITGHVLDVAVGPLGAALREYDPQLYLKWNPKKLRGHGVWEIRRRPELKTIRPQDVCVFQGNTLVVPKYHEIDIENHVLDVPFLNYAVLGKIKSMDMWEYKDMGWKAKNYVKVTEYKEAKFDEKVDENSSRELEYNLKQLKSEIRYLKDYLQSGGDPTRLAEYWPK